MSEAPRVGDPPDDPTPKTPDENVDLVDCERA
jgi:hypothetical protein